jgi:Zinc carboxypeptidase/Cytosolic carboxypeptidase N-terminal domain
MRILLLVAVVSLPTAVFADMKVRTDFPGGSAVVDKIDARAQRVEFRPGGDLKRGWLCWWYFKVDGLRPGETLTLDLAAADRFAFCDRASFSLDGKTWQHTPVAKRVAGHFVYELKVDADHVWIAWGPPFVLADAKRLVDGAAKKVKADVFELTKTSRGRSVWAIKIDETGSDAPDRPIVWIHARQHAWETGSSWVCKGFVEWIVSDDPEAVALRKQAVIVVVPIVDVDNVEDGCGGKSQEPHDNNRDWSETPIHPETKAMLPLLRRYGLKSRAGYYVDLHNPAPDDPAPFFFVAAESKLTPKSRGRLTSFLDAARLEIVGPLKLAAKTRESGPRYDKAWDKMSTNWVAGLSETMVAVCLETAWNRPDATTENYELVGRQLGKAIGRDLRGPDRDR